MSSIHKMSNPDLYQWFLKCDCKTSSFTNLGTCLEMQILGPYPRAAQSESLGMGPSDKILTNAKV